MSFGSPTGGQWGQPGGTGTPIDMLLRMGLPQGFVMGQLQPNQNIVSTLEAQRFQQTSWAATSFAAQNQHVLEQVNQAIAQANQTFHQNVSPVTSSNIGNYVQASMPIASAMGGGAVDALGLSAPGFTSAFVNSQRSWLYQRPNLNTAETGQRMGEISAGAYNMLYNSGGTPLQKTHGYTGTAAGELGAELMKVGRGPVGIMNQPAAKTPEQAQRIMAKQQQSLAQHIESATRFGSAVRDISPQFAGLNAQQTREMGFGLNLGGAHMTTDQMSGHVRRMTELGKMNADTGLSQEQVHGLQNQAGMFAQQLGLGQQVATGTTERTLAERLVFHKLGSQNMEDAGTNLNQLTQKSSMLGVQAVGSDVGKQMAALMALGKSGRLKGQAQAWYEQLLKGEYKYVDEGQFLTVMRQSGVNTMEAYASMTDPENLEKYGSQIAANAREQQWDVDIAPNVSMHVSNALSEASGGRMKTKHADRVAGIITKTLRATAGKSKEETLAAIEKALGDEAGIHGQQATDFASAAFHSANQFTQGLGYKGVMEAVDLHGSTLHAGAKQNMQKAKVMAKKTEKNAHKAQGGMAYRAMQGFLREGIPGLLKGLGNVTQAEPVEATAEEVAQETGNAATAKDEEPAIAASGAKRSAMSKTSLETARTRQQTARAAVTARKVSSRGRKRSGARRKGTPVVKYGAPHYDVSGNNVASGVSAGLPNQ